MATSAAQFRTDVQYRGAEIEASTLRRATASECLIATGIDAQEIVVSAFTRSSR